jgi:hypothetical protein
MWCTLWPSNDIPPRSPLVECFTDGKPHNNALGAVDGFKLNDLHVELRMAYHRIIKSLIHPIDQQQGSHHLRSGIMPLCHNGSRPDQLWHRHHGPHEDDTFLQQDPPPPLWVTDHPDCRALRISTARTTIQDKLGPINWKYFHASVTLGGSQQFRYSHSETQPMQGSTHPGKLCPHMPRLQHSEPSLEASLAELFNSLRRDIEIRFST